MVWNYRVVISVLNEQKKKKTKTFLKIKSRIKQYIAFNSAFY